MLKKLPLFIVGTGLLISSSMASTTLKSDKEKTGYLIGIQLGQQLLITKDDVDLDALKMGMQDVFSGNKPKLSNDEMRQAMMTFQTLKQKKEQEVIAKLSKEGEAYLEANKKKKGVVVLPSGLQYKVLKKGISKISPKATDTVVTHYEGRLINGTVFDSSYKRGQPASFPVNGVIKGWTEALQKMNVGDKWELAIPSKLAYGKAGAPPSIGPDATLVFDVELLEIK